MRQTLEFAPRINLPQHVALPLLTKLFRLAPAKDGEQLPANAMRIIDRHSSMYLVPTDETKEKHILVDGGMNQEAKNLRKFLGAKSLGLEAIQAVFVTHAHIDHVGALHALKGMKIPVFIGQRDADVIRGEAETEGPIPSFLESLPTARFKAVIPGLDLEALTDGDCLEFGNLKIGALELPGHTGGSTGYYIENSGEPGCLFVGDALDFDKNGETVNAARPFTHDRRQSAYTIAHLTERLVGFDVGAIVPAHSGSGTLNSLQKFSQDA